MKSYFDDWGILKFMFEYSKNLGYGYFPTLFPMKEKQGNIFLLLSDAFKILFSEQYFPHATFHYSMLLIN